MQVTHFVFVYGEAPKERVEVAIRCNSVSVGDTVFYENMHYRVVCCQHNLPDATEMRDEADTLALCVETAVWRKTRDRYLSGTKAAEKVTKPRSEKKEQFAPPSVGEIEVFVDENNLRVDAQDFWDFYETRGWVLSNGKKMANWKSAVRRAQKWDSNKQGESVVSFNTLGGEND